MLSVPAFASHARAGSHPSSFHGRAVFFRAARSHTPSLANGRQGYDRFGGVAVCSIGLQVARRCVLRRMRTGTARGAWRCKQQGKHRLCFTAGIVAFAYTLMPWPAFAADAPPGFPWLGFVAAVFILAGFIFINIAENGQAGESEPDAVRSVDDVLSLRRKSDFVALWRSGVPPTELAGREYSAKLIPLGILWASSWLITNLLFGMGRYWMGKGFSADGFGYNLFESGFVDNGAGDGSSKALQRLRRFRAAVASSKLDGRPALVLDYGADDCDAFWGKFAGMRDELREVAPGVILGLGSMRITGGAWNCVPFVMYDSSLAGGADK